MKPAGKRMSKAKLAGVVAGCIGVAILVAVLVRAFSVPAFEPLPPPAEGWIRLSIENVGSIDYPSDFLELQSGNYKQLTEGLHIVYEIASSDFSLQQVGLNELEPSALEEYRRVMFQTYYLNAGEEVFRRGQEYQMSQQELAEVKDELVSSLSQEFDRLRSLGAGDNVIVDSGTLEVAEVNGMFPLVWTYTRQLDDNPVVLVKYYAFLNYDKVHYLTFSYRVQDDVYCRHICKEILDSFRLQ